MPEALEDLRKSSGKQVHLLVGSDVARFILRYGGDLLGGWAERDNIKGGG
jgi:hypothetical protein